MNARALSGKSRSHQSVMASDDLLISHCVSYAQFVAAHEAGFEADPDGDNKVAEHLGGYRSKIEKALQAVAEIDAQTPEGLQAKARIVPFILRDTAGGMDEREFGFFQGFAADVKRILQPIINERRMAAKGAAA